jgi:hypothetical protein
MFNRIVAGLLMVGMVLGAYSASPGDAKEKGGGAVTQAASRGLTVETLLKAGWSCFQPSPERIVCAVPGLGLPPFPPVADSSPTFEFLGFDPVTHEYIGITHMVRQDLYAGQPCEGGGPYTLIPFLGYYECHIDHEN